MSERIGRASREKYQAFLDQALVLEFLDFEEYQERTGLLLAAKTMEDITGRVVHDFRQKDLNSWEDHWEKRREKGLALRPGLVTEPDRGPVDRIFDALAIGILVVPWILLVLALTGVL